MPGVVFNNESSFELDQNLGADFTEEYVQLAEYVLLQEQVPLNSEVSVTMVDTDDIAQLNADYRDKQGPTDVLSFPCDAEALAAARAATEELIGDDDPNAVFWADFDTDPDGEPLLLGDIVIAPSVAQTQALDYGKTLDDELRLLLVHGMLHLMGYDHVNNDEEAEAMEAREREILADWAELSVGEPHGGSKCGGGCCG
ncbi:MAG: rRNA maturation RNase YbeY [Coriobacteriia bacterium]|nr:rRNA maturation RNase YbeY [Coriobacteriia bacterium]